MAPEKFEALATLMGLRKAETREALRLVLCEGMTHEAAAERAGMRRPHVTRAVTNARETWQLARTATQGNEEFPAQKIAKSS